MGPLKVYILSFLFTILCAEEIRFCSIGMGNFGIPIARHAVQKGFKMVAAFTRYSKHTKTAGQLLGMPDDESLNFHVSGMKKLEQIIDETKPQFCIDATNSTLTDVFPHFRRLIAKGVHILTLNDEATFPNTRFNWKPRQLYRTLDRMAKENNVVILGSGYQDSVLMPVIPSMTAGMLVLNTVRFTHYFDLDAAGEEYLTLWGGGLTQDEFPKQATNDTTETWQRAVVEAMADQMGYPLLDLGDGKRKDTIQLYTRKECYKVENENGVESKALGKVIPKGDCAGMNVTIKGVARDNIEIYFSFILGVTPNKGSGDVDIVLSGVPNLEISIKGSDGYMVTAASLIHRIPMVLNELEPGFHTGSNLRQNRYFGKVDDWNTVDDVDTDESNEGDVELVEDTTDEVDKKEEDDSTKDKQDL